MLPKVKFELAILKYEVANLFDECVPLKTGWDWSGYVYQEHPRLKEELNKAKTRKEKAKVVRNYTKEFWRSEFEQLKTQKTFFQKEWNKINGSFMKTLSEVLETSWPKDRKIISGMISINPDGMRSLKYWAFQIFYMQRLYMMRGTVAEEVLHLLYFKKWKEVFPEANEKTFEQPYLEWALSEILVPAILGDKRLWKITKPIRYGYTEYMKIKIGKRNLIQHFENLYKESRKKKEPFAQFLQTAYKEAQKHKEKILKA